MTRRPMSRAGCSSLSYRSAFSAVWPPCGRQRLQTGRSKPSADTGSIAAADSVDTQPVADTRLGGDVVRLVGGLLDLLPELPDIDPEILHVGRVAPDLFQDEMVGQHLAGMLHQDAQDVVFLRREFYLLALDLDDALDQIDAEVAALENRLFALLLELVPQRDADARHQFVHAERLGDIVVGAEFQSLDDAGLVGAAGEDDDGNVEPVVTPFAQELMTAHAGQAEIEQHQVRLFLFHQLDRHLGVRRLADRIALAAETDPKQLADRRLVIDNQYPDIGICHEG